MKHFLGSSVSRKSSIVSSSIKTDSTVGVQQQDPSVSVRGLFREIQDLKKENLDLKLKIYFLEDSTGHSKQVKQLIEENVKMKIEFDNSQQEVERKQHLIEDTLKILDQQVKQISEYEKRIQHLGSSSSTHLQRSSLNLLKDYKKCSLKQFTLSCSFTITHVWKNNELTMHEF